MRVTFTEVAEIGRGTSSGSKREDDKLDCSMMSEVFGTHVGDDRCLVDN